MPLFDLYVIVDWSAASRPKQGRDSIWIAVGADLHNPPTRDAATKLVREVLVDAATHGWRVLVGWDFAFGFPAGTAARLGLASWRELWDLIAREIVDGADNTNNRFAVAAELNRRMGFASGPFWACPASAAGPNLSMRRGPVTELGEYRACEQWLRANGRLVHSPWKLFTTGSVGSQTLLGIPRVHSLRNDPRLKSHSAVWPFETATSKSDATAPCVWHAELWPPGFPVDYGAHAVRDAAQVAAVSARLRSLDGDGRLSDALRCPDISQGTEEGWVLSDPG